MKLSRAFSRSITPISRQLSHSALPPRLLRSRNTRTPSTPFQHVNPSDRIASRALFSTTRLTSASTSPLTQPPSSNTQPELETPSIDTPSYQLTFTCKVCQTRSSHRVSKQAYHYGATLIKCPGCENRHVMSDHLGIFTDKGQGGTLEDILARYGQNEGQKGTELKKGFVDGDLEFWDDGTVRERKEERERKEGPIGGTERLASRRSIDLGNREAPSEKASRAEAPAAATSQPAELDSESSSKTVR